jgi:hypothetical protein
MQENATPAVATCVTHIRPALPAERSFRVYMLDQYSTKHIALFLINLEISFSMYKFGCEWVFSFDVPEDRAPVVELFLANIPDSRPSADEILTPIFFSEGEIGHLDLAESQNFVAQVTGHGDTQYLADLWNAFAPGGNADVAEINPDPIPVSPASFALDEIKLHMHSTVVSEVA